MQQVKHGGVHGASHDRAEHRGTALEQACLINVLSASSLIFFLSDHCGFNNFKLQLSKVETITTKVRATDPRLEKPTKGKITGNYSKSTVQFNERSHN